MNDQQSIDDFFGTFSDLIPSQFSSSEAYFDFSIICLDKNLYRI